MWQHVLFDLDGTLTDPAEGITGAVRHAMQALGFPVPGQDVLQRFIGPPLDEIFAEVCGFDAEQIGMAIDAFREYFAETGIHQNILYPGTEQMLSAVSGAGCNLYIATTKPVHFAKQVLASFGLTHFFSYICGSELSHAGRPKGEVVREVLDVCRIEPQNAIMVGDRMHDVNGAHQNGLACIGLLLGYGGRAELADAGCDYYAEDMPALQHILLGGGTQA